MQQLRTRSTMVSWKSLGLLAGWCITGMTAFAGGGPAGGDKGKTGTHHKVAAPDTNLKLPAGFVAVKVAENLGNTRHIAVASNGLIYVKVDHLKASKGIYLLQDTNG